MKIDTTSPKSAILAELGSRLARARKERGYTQPELAEEAGIGVATLRRIEDGQDAHLGSWIKLLKALGMTDAIDGLLSQELTSPMAEVKGSGRKGRRKSRQATEKGRAVTALPQWGDETQ